MWCPPKEKDGASPKCSPGPQGQNLDETGARPRSQECSWRSSLCQGASALASVDHERLRDRLVPAVEGAPCASKRPFKLALPETPVWPPPWHRPAHQVAVGCVPKWGPASQSGRHWPWAGNSGGPVRWLTNGLETTLGALWRALQQVLMRHGRHTGDSAAFGRTWHLVPKDAKNGVFRVFYGNVLDCARRLAGHFRGLGRGLGDRDERGGEVKALRLLALAVLGHLERRLAFVTACDLAAAITAVAIRWAAKDWGCLLGPSNALETAHCLKAGNALT